MKSVVTIGLGYIGLPTSALIASSGIPVFGVDINKEVVKTINRGEIHIVEPQLQEIVKSVVEKGFLRAATKAVKSKVYLIVVPTPFKDDYQPDTSHVEAATRQIIPLLEEDDLFILESTSPVGTTERIADLIYSLKPELRNKINIAYCPERVLPGNIMHELVYNDRVIGGIDENSTSRAIDFYSQFVKGKLHPTNARTAEMCKLTENASRDVQIAFANELSMICEKANIDTQELIELANKHPRVNILNPGCGVGGHCIAVDPYFITTAYPEESKLIQTARMVNNNKTDWCLNKINQEIEKFRSSKQRLPKVGLYGLAYKANVDDLRESPAMKITKALWDSYPKNLLYISEPNISKHELYEITPFKSALNTCELNFILVGHIEFVDFPKDLITIDFVGINE